MLFGLYNDPSTFQRVIDKIFKEDICKFVISWFDDIIVFSKSLTEHEIYIKTAIKKYKITSITLNESKYMFFKKEVKNLGNIMSKNMIKLGFREISVNINYNILINNHQMIFSNNCQFCEKTSSFNKTIFLNKIIKQTEMTKKAFI